MLTDSAQSPISRKVNEQSIAVCVCLAIVYVAFSVLLPLHRFDFAHLSEATKVLLVIGPTTLFMLLQLLLIWSIVHLALNPKSQLILGLVAIAFWLFEMAAIHPLRSSSQQALILILVLKSSLLGVTLTIALSLFGSQLSLIIKERNMLLPVALIAMPVDFLGAMTSQGFTHDMIMHAPKFVSSVSVSVPKITAQTAHGVSIGPIAFIGPGDVLFMALFFAAVQKFRLAERATFWWMYGLLTISMILVIRLPDFEVGALVPMGLAVIIANFRLIKLKRDEVFAVGYAGILVLILVGFFFWSSHRYLFHSH